MAVLPHGGELTIDSGLNDSRLVLQLPDSVGTNKPIIWPYRMRLVEGRQVGKASAVFASLLVVVEVLVHVQRVSEGVPALQRRVHVSRIVPGWPILALVLIVID